MMHGNLDNHELVIVSKYFAPINSVDSTSVYDLICELLKHNSNLKIHVVTTNVNYKSNIKVREFSNEILCKIRIHRINVFSIKRSRIFTDLLTGFKLITYARSLNIRHIVSLSNPPFISTWCSILLHNRNFIYWSFDIFPDALIANKFLRRTNPLFLFLDFIKYRRSPYGIIALGPMQFEYLSSRYLRYSQGRDIKRFILPCGIHQIPVNHIKPKWVDQDKILIGYIGNIGKAHSREFLINSIMEFTQYKNIKLILSVYGEHAKVILDFVSALNDRANIEIVESIMQNELGYIDIHLVSLLEEWTNISVPSKAVSATCAGSALWFSGSKQSDTFFLFNESSFYSDNSRLGIRKVLESLDLNLINKKKAIAKYTCKKLVDLETRFVKDLLEILD